MGIGSQSVKAKRAVLAALLLALLAATGWAWMRRGARVGADGDVERAAHAVVPEGQAPAGIRIRVQVLNATRTRGLGRRATLLLRDRGFDVVETGTTHALRDSTLILHRSNHQAW